MMQPTDRTCRLNGLSTCSFAQRKANQFSPFLTALTEAMEYATDLSTSPWEFALQVDHARDFELCENDLRWMIKKGWIEHQTEELMPVRKVAAIQIHKTSRFIISKAGISVSGENVIGYEEGSALHAYTAQEAHGLRGPLKPNWDTVRRELLIFGRVVKRFRWPAPNQETILSVFSEEDWPARIEDPLSQGNGLEPKRRLGDTIKCLNRNQHENLIRFRGDGTGEGVLWDIVDSKIRFGELAQADN